MNNNNILLLKIIGLTLIFMLGGLGGYFLGREDGIQNGFDPEIFSEEDHNTAN